MGMILVFVKCEVCNDGEILFMVIDKVYIDVQLLVIIKDDKVYIDGHIIALKIDKVCIDY